MKELELKYGCNPNQKPSRIFMKNDDLYLFLSNIQETVHEFAISFFRKTKTKGMFLSRLDGIKGLGPKKKEALLKKYITIKDNHWLNTLDSYSFYVYITHHIYLVGPLSFVTFIPNKIILILVVTLLIILSSIILKKISDYITKLL